MGTGRNLPFYPRGIRLTGIDLTPAMLAVADSRARDLGMDVELVEGDAQALPFADSSFDTAVCTLALNAIPDDRAAIAEMYRVLRPGGRLLLLGHVASHHRVVRAVQRLLEKKSLPIAGDHQTRQPVPILLRHRVRDPTAGAVQGGHHPTRHRGQTRQAVTRRARSQAGRLPFRHPRYCPLWCAPIGGGRHGCGVDADRDQAFDRPDTLTLA